MPRENSFSDEGRSLTPDLEEEAPDAPVPLSPVYNQSPTREQIYLSSGTQYRRDAAPKCTPMTPKERFRLAVRKVIALHRIPFASRGIGAEPGIDPRRVSAELQYGGIKQNCAIQIFDYSFVRNTHRQMTNKEFVDFMANPAASEHAPRAKVRWIHIGGKSWDVIRAVSLRYGLHPLALEDVFNESENTRSKADYYLKHLFLKIMVHELTDTDQPAHGFCENIKRSPSSFPHDDDKTLYSNEYSLLSTVQYRKCHSGHADEESRLVRSSLSFGFLKMPSSNRRRYKAEEVALQLLKDDHVNVRISPMFIFLLRDGTVISLHDDPNDNLIKPIAFRLNERDTLLRTSADPSLLVQSLLDLTVDKALEVVEEYHLRIAKLERNVLLNPTIKTVKKLHLLSGDLILYKRTLEPIKTVVYGLRRYDLDRCAALIDPSNPANADVRIVGYMSHKSKIYLADVHDHMEYILSTLDMIAGVGENLIDYAFNMKSYEMSEVMRRLTLATIIFLPLTLLTGYFGMNFKHMWSIRHGHSDIIFWIIALPVMLIVIPLFLITDIKTMVHYIHKRFLAKRVIQTVRSS